MLIQDVSEDSNVRWRGFSRIGRKGLKPVNPGSWYPVYFEKSDDSLHSVGDAISDGEETPQTPDGTYAIWPLVCNGEEYSWAMVIETFRRLHAIGAIKFGKPVKGQQSAGMSVVQFFIKGRLSGLQNQRVMPAVQTLQLLSNLRQRTLIIQNQRQFIPMMWPRPLEGHLNRKQFRMLIMMSNKNRNRWN